MHNMKDFKVYLNSVWRYFNLLHVFLLQLENVLFTESTTSKSLLSHYFSGLVRLLIYSFNGLPHVIISLTQLSSHFSFLVHFISFLLITLLL